MQLNAVVLPAPFGPISPTISNSLTSSETSSSACSPPNRIDRSRTSSTDTGALHSARPGVLVAVQREPPAGQPAGQRRELLPDAARVQDDGEQQEQRADELRCVGLRVVAAEDEVAD